MSHPFALETLVMKKSQWAFYPKEGLACVIQSNGGFE